MPRRDGTGPLGQGEMTGKGLGMCSGLNQTAYGLGLGKGLGRGFYCKRFNFNPAKDEKAVLIEQKAILEARLNAINKQLND